MVVGGAGSLEVSPGLRLLDSPGFPVEFRSEAQAQAAALDYYRTITDVPWTYVSPAAVIEPGNDARSYRTGADTLLTDSQGISKISMNDYAAAIVDELESPKAIRRRMTVGY